MSTNASCTTDTSAATTGITVSPEMWNQMQAMLAMFQAQQPNTATPFQVPKNNPATPSDAICPSLSDPTLQEPTQSSINPNDCFDPVDEELPDDLDLFGVAPIGSEEDDPDTVILTVHEDAPSFKPPPTRGNTNKGPKDTDAIEAYDYSSFDKLDPPPVPSSFESKDNLFRFCQNWAKAHAYAVATGHSPEQLEEVGRLRKSNLKPAQILLQLRTADPDTLATNRTISNALQKQRRVELNGKTPIEALLCILKETNWSWEAKYTQTGATATNRSFSIAFCFMTYEDDKNYLWAVNILKNLIWRPERIPKVFVTDRDAALRKALATVFPNSQANLCTWHLNTNIATNCKKALGQGWNDFIQKWNQVTYSKTAEIYVERWNALKTHLAKLPTVVHYIETSIIPVKELFVVAWACQYPHLRNLTTSRVESGHAFLKTFIKNSTGDFLTVFQSLALAVDTQLNAAHQAIAKDTMKALVNVPKCFIPLLCKISTIAEILESGEGLSPDDFHDQWHLRYNPKSTQSEDTKLDVDAELHKLMASLSNEHPSQLEKVFLQLNQVVAGSHIAVPVQGPGVKTNPKGRPTTISKRKAASTSTKRNPSAHEIVDAELEKAKPKSTKKQVAAKAARAKGRKSKRLRKEAKDTDDGEDVGDLPDAEDLL
ncbi:hypothetical protein MJO29_009475 [Puccinia striiformis f. sp. tritici]|nr:hypothetical protein MJO29_009475 [Puccinia striiformis f. sp. tritici]